MDDHTLDLPHNKAIRSAKNLSFDEFTSSKDESVLIYISDFHFRQICNSPWEMGCDAPITMAKNFISEMPCAFICEYPEESSALLEGVLGLSSVPRLNITDVDDSKDFVTSSAVKNILSVNERDMSIYDFAVGRFLSSGR
jgi:hypothetical protein